MTKQRFRILSIIVIIVNASEQADDLRALSDDA